MTFVQLTDPHLSDQTNTATWQALHWAVAQIKHIKPDLLLITGDVTTYGTASAARAFCDVIHQIQIPRYFTPGNAEHRSAGALPELAALGRYKSMVHNNHLFLFPDTSKGKLSAQERDNLDRVVAQHPNRTGCIVATHYPVDALDNDGETWLEHWLNAHSVELLVAGHKHIDRTRKIGTCTEIITRGLDPDKAVGGLPGITVFEKSETKSWKQTHISWGFPLDLRPQKEPFSPVGWSIQGDPIDAVNETREAGLSCLELRPADLTFSLPALNRGLSGLRKEQNLYLSWHLPSLTWDGTAIHGHQMLQDQLQCACDIGVQHLTVHVPQAPAHTMQDPTLWRQFEDCFDHLFRQPVANGINLAIENVHNAPGVATTDPKCKFATDIDTYVKWINAIAIRLNNAPNIGAHFDIGHARNNGTLGNIQPLSDWYARVGKYILGYHIHQIRPDPKTGKMANHKEMHDLFELRISYAGFLYAWSTQQINRAPLFVEIRNPEERRRSTHRLQKLFERAANLHTSTDLE